MSIEHEVMQYDVIIVGAGPAGLAAAIRLKQLALESNTCIKVCVLEKGAQIGSHILAGAVLDPKSLRSLLPDTWGNAPLTTPVIHDAFYVLSKHKAYRMPTPRTLNNAGNYIVSLAELCRFLAAQAQDLGCEIYPGFAATQVLYNTDGSVTGVATGDLGLDSARQPTSRYQPGLHLHAKQTFFAEGCRGQLSQSLMERFHLRDGVSPQTYGLGIKELWTVTDPQHVPGQVIHSVGWPLDRSTYGGGFLYTLDEQRIAVGFVVGLDYKNPWLSPFEEFQKFKTHPMISKFLYGGQRNEYGARSLNEGGWQSLPELTFPGGMLLGDAAGFLNVPKLKGIHTAIESGCLAAAAYFADSKVKNLAYKPALDQSWMAKELYAVRNIRPAFRAGLWAGLAYAAFETYVTHGRVPWTFKQVNDYATLKTAALAKKIHYPPPDGVLTFDRLSSVYLSGTYHAEQQPVHLTLRDPELAILVNYQQYASPETRYCPAAVYEINHTPAGPELLIHAQNCVHCKACDIKDPRQNIVWTAPEGGGGPNYVRM